MKNQKGITLIALVITIIVLLILAGVSIAMLTGENGILTQANNSKSATAKAEAVEKINLALNAVKSEIFNQQVASSSYEPLTSTGTDASKTYALNGTALTTILGKDNVVEAKADTTKASGTYYYSLDKSTGVLTISYHNTTTNVGTAEKPIYGTINLSASPYTITEAPITAAESGETE